VPNDTEAHRAVNRRVDIVMLSETRDNWAPDAGPRPAAESAGVHTSDSAAPEKPTPMSAENETTAAAENNDQVRLPVEARPTHFRVQPFMPKINLRAE
jgi:hypothetical protein